MKKRRAIKLWKAIIYTPVSSTVGDFDESLKRISLNKRFRTRKISPLLVYLKLIGNCAIFDGKQWEHFVQANLSHLNQFEFHIHCGKLTEQTREDLDLFVQSNRSAF